MISLRFLPEAESNLNLDRKLFGEADVGGGVVE